MQIIMTAQKLKEARQLFGLSVKDSARIFGYPIRTWYAYEEGARPVKANLEAAIAFYEKIPKGKRPL